MGTEHAFEVNRKGIPGFDRIDYNSRNGFQELISIHSGGKYQVLSSEGGDLASMRGLRTPSFVATLLNCPPSRLRFESSAPGSSTQSYFLVVNSGKLVLHIDQEHIEVKAGGVVIVAPGSGGSETEFIASNTEVATLVLDCHPRSLWEGRASVETASEPSINTFAFGALRGLALSPVPTTRSAAHRLETAAQLLARSLLSEDGTSPVASLHASAMRYIRTHSVDVNLVPEMVAEHFRVSIRTLQHELHKNGTTPAAAIRQARAEAAAQIRAIHPGLDSATIALKSGFASTRAMKRVIGDLSSQTD